MDQKASMEAPFYIFSFECLSQSKDSSLVKTSLDMIW